MSREEVKTPHFFFGEVATKSEFNKELIVVIKQMLRRDEYSEWEEGYTRAMGMDKESLLLAESYETEEIKKYFTCCECPADYEMAVIGGGCRSASNDSTTSSALNWQPGRPANCTTRSKS